MEMDLRKLTKKVGRGQGLSLVAVRSFGKQLFVALKLVHSLNYVHADLKPDNVVVGKKRSLIKVRVWEGARVRVNRRLSSHLPVCCHPPSCATLAA